MKQYLDLLQDILTNGNDRGDRTGTGTRSVFGRQLRFDLSEGFPLMTTKKLAFRWIVEELLWFLSGSTNAADLQAKGVKIWDEWATAEQCAKFEREAGDLGPVYGHQWRNWGGGDSLEPGLDQISQVIDGIKANPEGRRHIVSGWHPVEQAQVALPPCHTLFQFYVREEREWKSYGDDWHQYRDYPPCEPPMQERTRRYLDCQLYQRSCDVFLGVPYNIASYALLIHMVAHVTGCVPGEFVHTFGDVHIYDNHREQVAEQLSREPRKLPQVKILTSIEEATNEMRTDLLSLARWHHLHDWQFSDFELTGYKPLPSIKAEVSV